MPAFRDFNFKLLVIEKLMYDDETLTPAFRIADCLKAKGIDDPQTYAYDNDLAFTVLDEARAHFEALEISPELLATVETLDLDGGLRVYQECSPSGTARTTSTTWAPSTTWTCCPTCG